MLPMRSAAAAAPCSLAALLLRRLSSNSSSSISSVHRLASFALSSQPSASFPTTRSPCPLSVTSKTRGFTAWASAPGPAGPAESPATKALEAKVSRSSWRPTRSRSSTPPGTAATSDVVSKAFEGKSAVNRQRMVYKAIWEELQSTVHAVDQMTTKTPDEAAANK
ncbi:unnamed protein product [Urochloa decumbens]|uniref:Uncharacterized protein n=1 Tax=Urochloa decumbens TaxID=240449 RepID=A0ABC9DYS3_9POAL